jgi:hypothetical protein
MGAANFADAKTVSLTKTHGFKVVSLLHTFKFNFYRSVSERRQHRLSILPYVDHPTPPA